MTQKSHSLIETGSHTLVQTETEMERVHSDRRLQKDAYKKKKKMAREIYLDTNAAREGENVSES